MMTQQPLAPEWSEFLGLNLADEHHFESSARTFPAGMYGQQNV